MTQLCSPSAGSKMKLALSSVFVMATSAVASLPSPPFSIDKVVTIGDEVCLDLISMSPSHKGRGFGSLLIQVFERRCILRGARRITLGSSSDEYVEHFYT